MFKIQLENGEFYKSSKGSRVRHYASTEKADTKIAKLGEIASGAKIVECNTKTKNAKVRAIFFPLSPSEFCILNNDKLPLK